MGQLTMICLFLVTMTTVPAIFAAIYPFYQHEQCTLSKLNISELAGDWNMMYHKNNLGKKVTLKISLVNETTLSTSNHEDGNLVNTSNLTQNPNLAGKLEMLINRDSWRMAIPTFVLSFEPGKFLTLYHSKVNGSDDDYAIYSKDTNELSSQNYEKAVQGLNCLNLPGAKEGKLQLHKL